jgi:hypothetical protein
VRPLALGDILNGAVAGIRRNPGATIGIAAIVVGSVAVADTFLSLAVSHSLSSAADALSSGTARTADLSSFFSSAGVLFGVSLFLSLAASIVLTGLIPRPVLGLDVSIGQAWRLARPRLGAILGLALLVVVIYLSLWAGYGLILAALIAGHLDGLAAAFGILAFLAVAVTEVMLWTRFSLAAPVVVLERLGPRAALRRSWQLVDRSFWRVLGILLLAAVIVAIASLILQLPFDFIKTTVGGGFSTVGGSTSTGSILVGGIGSIVAGAVTAPVSAGVVILLYTDMRMRKEGLDLVLRDAAQNRQLTGDEFAALWRAPTTAPGHAPGQGAPTAPPPSW